MKQRENEKEESPSFYWNTANNTEVLVPFYKESVRCTLTTHLTSIIIYLFICFFLPKTKTLNHPNKYITNKFLHFLFNIYIFLNINTQLDFFFTKKVIYFNIIRKKIDKFTIRN